MVPHPYRNQNLVVNHIGIAVDSVDKAAEWYGKHFGFRRIRNDRMTDRCCDSPDSPIFRIYGDKLNKVKVAWLATGNGVGFEIFEFIDPPTKSAEEITSNWSLENQVSKRVQDTMFSPPRLTIFISTNEAATFTLVSPVQTPIPSQKKPAKDGAVQIGETITMFDGEKALYLRDPWGCVVEILSCSFEQLMGNRA